VFNRETVIAGLFRERIAPGAFTEALKRSDVRGLFNHNPSQLLGRSSAGTMRLTEGSDSLLYEIDPPDTSVARDVTALIKRGDVTGSSFAFTVRTDEWTKATTPGDLPLRTIKEIDELRDVGPVTFPAYEETTVQARDAASAARLVIPIGDLGALSRFRSALAILECE
jgi:HK97 family phage prohead protease